MSLSGWYRRISAFVARHGGRHFLAIVDRYNATGGSLLAGGLAYSALFAIVPLALLTAGLTGLLVSDPGVRSQVVLTIADVLPPLRGLLEVILEEAARSAAAISVIGGATLAWGGSRFVIAFEEAVSRVVGGARKRGVLQRNLIGLVTAVLLVATVILGAILTGVGAFLDAAVAENQIIGLSRVARGALDALPLILASGAIALVYRFVPEERPSWGATWVPAVTIGVILSISARLFVFIAPRMIGAAATLGSLATVFAALAWLGLTFQAILFGGAWVGDRRAARVDRNPLAGGF
ncbi:MAG: YihY/virulence factor BrkB family protein [Chloroflexota bacterium]